MGWGINQHRKLVSSLLEDDAMKWNHDYKMRLSIGFSGAEHSDEINPSLNFDEEEWNEMPEEEQRKWLEETAEEWAWNYIEVSVAE